MSPFAAAARPGDGALAVQRRARWRGIANGIASALAGRGVSIAVMFLSVPLTIGYLGPERYGAWVALASLLAWLSLADLGFCNGFANAVTQAAGEDRPDLVRRHIANVLVLLSLLAGVFGAVALIAVPRVDWPALLGLTSPAGRAEIGPAIIEAVLILLLNLPLGIVAKILLAYREGHLANGWSAAGNIAAFLGLVCVIHTKGGLPALVIATSGAGLAVNAASLAWLLGMHRPDLRPRAADIARSTMPDLLQTGGPFFVIQILSLIVFETDTLIAGHYRGAASVPAYSLAYTLFTCTSLPQNLAFTYLWSAYTEAIARRDIAWVHHVFRASFIAGLGFTAAATSVLLVAAAPFIHWWTEGAVTPGRSLVFWLAAWSLIHAATNPHACLLAAAGRLRWQIIYSAAAAACNIPLSIHLVRIWGLPGIIAGTVITYAIFICVPIHLDTNFLLRKLRAAEGLFGN
jgi:O-antigen/teichoic acid export membrane protein